MYQLYRRLFSDMDIKISDIDEIDNNENKTCLCEVPNKNIAYHSTGCLKCTSQDCAFYIQNALESIFILQNKKTFVKPAE
jgi:hypothetical protein